MTCREELKRSLIEYWSKRRKKLTKRRIKELLMTKDYFTEKEFKEILKNLKISSLLLYF